MKLVSFLISGALVAPFGMIACSSDEDASNQPGTVASGARSACSTGPAYAFETEFPSTETVDSSLPECVPRCENGDKRSGYSMAASAWLLAALPRGASSEPGAPCQMAAVRYRVCPSGETSMCSYTPYECRCEGGNWRCYSGPPGASACTCTQPVDAGGD